MQLGEDLELKAESFYGDMETLNMMLLVLIYRDFKIDKVMDLSNTPLEMQRKLKKLMGEDLWDIKNREFKYA